MMLVWYVCVSWFGGLGIWYVRRLISILLILVWIVYCVCVVLNVLGVDSMCLSSVVSCMFVCLCVVIGIFMMLCCSVCVFSWMLVVFLICCISLGWMIILISDILFGEWSLNGVLLCVIMIVLCLMCVLLNVKVFELVSGILNIVWLCGRYLCWMMCMFVVFWNSCMLLSIVCLIVL